jgi:hypothetical protein
VQLGLLGPLTLRGDDGAELRVPGAAKERGVLIHLGLRATQTVAPTELIDFRWGVNLFAHADGAQAALEMLAALRRYWFLRSDLAEWASRMDGLLQREDPAVSSLIRGKALVAATLSAAYVDATAARRWGEMAATVARAAGDNVSASEATSLLAVISYFLGVPDPGLGQQAVAAARRTGDPVLVGQALFGAAMAHVGEPARACELGGHHPWHGSLRSVDPAMAHRRSALRFCRHPPGAGWSGGLG